MATLGTNRITVTKVLESSVVSTVVGAVLAFGVLPRVLHGIHIERYGEWATLAAVLAIGQLAEAGVSTEVARRVATAFGEGDLAGVRRAVREGTTVLVGIAALLEVVGLASARPVVNLVFTTVSPGQRGQLVLLLMGIVTLLAIGLVGSGYFAVLSGLQRSDYANWSGIASGIVGAIVTVVGIAVGLGLWALFLTDLVQLLVRWVGPFIGTRRIVPDLRLRLVRVSRPVILGFIGMPAMLMVAMASDLFDSQVDKLVLTHAVGPGASGMFQIGVNVVLSAKGVAVIPLAVLLAGTAELYLTSPARLRRLEALAGMSAQAIAAVAAGGFVIFSPAFLHAWLGAGYGPAALSMRFLAIAVLLNMWSAPWIYYAIGRGRYHYVLIAASATVVVNALSTIFLTARIGLLGALIGSVAGAAAGTTTGWLVLRRWEHRHWLRPAFRASGVVAVVVCPFLAVSGRIPASWIPLILWGCGYIAACGLLLLITRSLPMSILFRAGLPRITWRGEPLAGSSPATGTTVDPTLAAADPIDNDHLPPNP